MNLKAEVGSRTSAGNSIVDFLDVHMGAFFTIGQLFSRKATPTTEKSTMDLFTFMLVFLLLGSIFAVTGSVLQAEVSLPFAFHSTKLLPSCDHLCSLIPLIWFFMYHLSNSIFLGKQLGYWRTRYRDEGPHCEGCECSISRREYGFG